MSLTRQLLKTIVIWCVVFVTIILIVLIPRNVEYVSEGNTLVREYEFCFCEYRQNILILVDNVWKNQSFGQNRFGQPVEEDLKRYIPRSILVIAFAFILSIPLGVLKGIFDYKHRAIFGKVPTWFLQSLPDFFIIILFQIGVIMLMRMGFPQIQLYSYDQWYSFIIPALFLSMYPTLYLARIVSTSLSEEEGLLYVQMARAKGLKKSYILYKHILGNCWATILSHLSSVMLYMISNLLIIEYLMYYLGAAYRLYQALGFHDVSEYSSQTFEPYVVIGFSFFFLILVLVTQIISQIARYIVSPVSREASQ